MLRSDTIKWLIAVGLFGLLTYKGAPRVYGWVTKLLIAHEIQNAPARAETAFKKHQALFEPATTEESYTPADPGTLTYTNDIAPIVQERCVICHSPGQIAPFPLLTYEQVKKRGRMIAKVTGQRLMPPWKPVRGIGEFHDDYSLSAVQIGQIQQWVSEGCKEGTASQPLTPKSVADWELGPPDAIIQVPAYDLSGEGADLYRCFVIPTDFGQDRFVSAVDIKPSSRRVIHHAVVCSDTTGKARELDAADPEPGYTTFGALKFQPAGTLGGWAPGFQPRHLRDGVAYFVKRGSDVVVQLHLRRTGKAEKISCEVGLYYSKKPVDKQIRVLMVAVPPRNIQIPGNANLMLSGNRTVPGNITLEGIFPHMHMVGRQIMGCATEPGGKMLPLIRVNDWDFDWQATYWYKRPIPLPAGSKLQIFASFDNSPTNPVNPNNPPQPVRFGEQTTDEMCVLYTYYTVDSEFISKGIHATGYPDSYTEFRYPQKP